MFRSCIPTRIVRFARNIRSTVKVCDEKFYLALEVNNYTPDEIRVKAAPDFVVVEGKQERKTDRGYVIRRFVRKFKLPEGCIVDKMESKLNDGTLTIMAPRSTCPFKCERLIPVKVSGEKCQETKSDAAGTKPTCGCP